LDAAQKEYEQALQLAPQDPEVHWQLFVMMVLRGEFPQAWQEYEWRWHVQHRTTPKREFAQPKWDGSLLQGRTILLWAEQGFGDSIQIARYIPLVQARGGRILLWCPPELEALLCTVSEGIEVFSQRAQKTYFDIHLPLMSLPLVFGTTLETIPNQVPYLRVPKATDFRLPTSGDQRLRVGLVWCGSKSQPNDRRPIPFEYLLPLLEMEGVEFFSLQVGSAADDPSRFSAAARIVDLRSRLTDFAMTAAAIDQLDLVITVDT
jgi:hypothetical protein